MWKLIEREKAAIVATLCNKKIIVVLKAYLKREKAAIVATLCNKKIIVVLKAYLNRWLAF